MTAGRPSRHWLVHRLSAVALVPLSLWLLASLLSLSTFEYSAVAGWVARGWTPLLLLLFLLTAAYHSQLGVREVIEDYVHGASSKTVALLAVTSLHVVFVLAGAGAILKLAFGAAA